MSRVSMTRSRKTYGLEISDEKNGLKSFWKKRLLGVCLPFWAVELVGLLATSTFSIKAYLLDLCFLKPATSYGWFMGYIVICYLIFYAVKMLIKDRRMQMVALFGLFAIWFVLESIFFANPDMPLDSANGFNHQRKACYEKP